MATNYLLEFAASSGNFDWFSIHSGVDMVIKPVSDFADYLETDKKFYYGNFGKFPLSGWGYKGGFGRICLKWPKYFRKKAGKRSLRRLLRGLYGRMYSAGLIKGKKIPEKYELYGGSVWFTASKECVKRMLNILKKDKEFDSLFKNSLSSDEIYYVTLLKMAQNDEPASENNHLRYINWSNCGAERSVGGPNTLSMDFLEDIEKSDRFFARKFDIYHDSKIVKYLEEKY
ncbi:MAG: beta-1,6-N-acetylglucosaminyltransferase [Clostridia bacterium]|nr:beta-1,6-N-acetylglucosaminyltransferase [Clostridia bacterium]